MTVKDFFEVFNPDCKNFKIKKRFIGDNDYSGTTVFDSTLIDCDNDKLYNYYNSKIKSIHLSYLPKNKGNYITIELYPEVLIKTFNSSSRYEY